jgi:hypothetical protein
LRPAVGPNSGVTGPPRSDAGNRTWPFRTSAVFRKSGYAEGRPATHGMYPRRSRSSLPAIGIDARYLVRPVSRPSPRARIRPLSGPTAPTRRCLFMPRSGRSRRDRRVMLSVESVIPPVGFARISRRQNTLAQVRPCPLHASRPGARRSAQARIDEVLHLG